MLTLNGKMLKIVLWFKALFEILKLETFSNCKPALHPTFIMPIHPTLSKPAMHYFRKEIEIYC